MTTAFYLTHDEGEPRILCSECRPERLRAANGEFSVDEALDAFALAMLADLEESVCAECGAIAEAS